PLPFSLSLSPPSSSLKPNFSSLNKRRRRRAFEPPPADHLSTSPFLLRDSLKNKLNGENEKKKTLLRIPGLEGMTAAAALRPTPSSSTLSSSHDKDGDGNATMQAKRKVGQPAKG
ncbi:hypothetical protein LINPERHAP2_LOCUS22743, partial [Linum perenne]